MQQSLIHHNNKVDSGTLVGGFMARHEESSLRFGYHIMVTPWPDETGQYSIYLHLCAVTSEGKGSETITMSTVLHEPQTQLLIPSLAVLNRHATVLPFRKHPKNVAFVVRAPGYEMRTGVSLFPPGCPDARYDLFWVKLGEEGNPIACFGINAESYSPLPCPTIEL